jgi:hypothetical protein
VVILRVKLKNLHKGVAQDDSIGDYLQCKRGGVVQDGINGRGFRDPGI